MSELSEFQLGQPIELSDGRPATIRFFGTTHFASGDWIGVELDERTGKNDGEVQGQRYFDCPANTGMFVRPAAVVVLDLPPQGVMERPAPKQNGTSLKPRPSSMFAAGSKRQSLVDPKGVKRQSINAPSPTPASRVSRLASPSKSPTKQLGSNATSNTSSRTGTPSTSGPRKSMLLPSKPSRPSMAPPTTTNSTSRAARPSIGSRLNGSAKPAAPAPATSRLASRRDTLNGSARGRVTNFAPEKPKASNQNGQAKEEVNGSTQPQSEEDSGAEAHKPSVTSPLSETPITKRTRNESASTTRSPISQRPSAQSMALTKESEDLKAKIRVLEKKVAEGRDRLKDLEKVQGERDHYEIVIKKMQTKYQPQQQELADLRKQLKDELDKMAQSEEKLAEQDTMLEVATLDREMAEETAESIKLELEALRQKHEEIELEVSVLREENDELGKDISPEDKTSQGWLQLERSNERLREALMRLRDITQEREADLKEQVAELEADAEELAKLKERYALVKAELEQSNLTVEDLRSQLDTALGAEDMIEELTEKNMSLNEKIEELNLTVEELESLRELNDELELNHVENERQLQDEIDYHESILSDEVRKAAVQDGTIQDLEYTVSRFRGLVATMQSDLEDMRASQQITESEATELSNRSRAMMDLNMKLQTSASKTQMKAIDMELGKLQAQESLQHLSIVQLFLPDTFSSEQDSVQALLRFRRLNFKARLLHDNLRERLTGQAVLLADEDVPTICDLLDKLVWTYSTCERFVNYIQICDVNSFKRLGGAAYELDPLERAFNVWIDSLRKDELKFESCAAELQRSIAMLDHLAEIHISTDLEHFPDHVLAQIAVMQSHVESASLAIGFLKTRLESTIATPENDDTSAENEYLEIFERLDNLTSQSRSAKVIIGKTARQIEDLRSRSLTLDSSTLNVLEHTRETTADYISAIRSFGASVLKSLADEMQEADTEFARISSALSSGSTSLSSLAHKVQGTTAQIQTFYNLSLNLAQTVEFTSPPPPPPWKLLAQKMREEKNSLLAQEREYGRLKDELSEKKNTLAMKDKMLDELSVKTEVLEKRVGETGGRRERVRELEEAASASKVKEKDYVSKLSVAQKHIETLEREHKSLKETSRSAPANVETAPAAGEARTPASAVLHIETLKSEISSLQSTIRYLRTAHHHDLLQASNAYLLSPLTRPPPSPPNTQIQAKEALREMLHLVTQASAQPIKLQRRPKGERLRWRPAKDTGTWQLQRQREDWEEWREWRDVVSSRSKAERREEKRQLKVKQHRNLDPSVGLPEKAATGGVKIVGLDEHAPSV